MAESAPANEPSFSFRVVISGIKKRFPGVENISTADLNKLVKEAKQDGGQRVVIVDARPEPEFDVSHIPSAIRIDSETEDMAVVMETIQEQLTKACSSPEARGEPINVVMYCSVGYRSSLLAQKFSQSLEADRQKQGKATQHPSDSSTSPNYPTSSYKVFNLEGSLFKWANEGRPMTDIQGSPTKFVHPYNAVFGRLVSKDIRRWEGP